MRKQIFLLLLIPLLLLLAHGALAAEYTFSSIDAVVTVPETTYDPVLTPENLAAHEAFLQEKGLTVEEAEALFQSKGVVLRAYDKKENRVLEITALDDADGKQYFDINQQTPDTRAHYRRSHGKGGAYALLGYTYDSIEWRNFPHVGRFLMLRYAYRQNGELVCRGFQRRSVRNGHTITVDMQVYGRTVKGGDNTALNKVFDTLRFTADRPMPELPLVLIEKKTAPVEVSEPAFQMTGKTAPGARLYAVVTSFSVPKAEFFETYADRNGNYKLNITLPREDLFLMTLTVSKEGALSTEIQRSINYQKGLLPVSLDAEPPATLTEDSYTLSGSTESGVTVQLNVNDVNQTRRTNNNRTFSFKIDTYEEGHYRIRLVLSKKGYDTRTFEYECDRALDDNAKIDRVKAEAAKPAYKTLVRKIDSYDGRLVTMAGYIVAKEEKAGEWITEIALTKKGDKYTDRIITAADRDFDLPINTKVRVYGTVVGMNNMLLSDNTEVKYPKLQLVLMEAAD